MADNPPPLPIPSGPNAASPFESEVPETCTSTPCMVGIDEAGRGPTLGPMVYGLCFCPVAEAAKLKACGFDDSKALSQMDREAFFAEIRSAPSEIALNLGWHVTVLTPEYISESMLRQNKYNLNAMSHDTAIGMIRRAIKRGVNVTEVYVDTVGDPKKYEAKLSHLFPGIKCVVRKKADSLYPIVSAASICAKVTRDYILSHWTYVEDGLEGVDREFGSGYPGDPKTLAWMTSNLDEFFGFPSVVRFSWGPSKKRIADGCITVDWGDDDEEGDAGQIGIADFFAAASQPPKRKRAKYFHRRMLEVAEDL